MLNFLRGFLPPSERLASGAPDPRHPGWKEYTHCVELVSGATLRLRPLCQLDGDDWCTQRLADKDVLEPVEPTVDATWEHTHSREGWRGYYTSLMQSADLGLLIPFVIELDGRFVGQVTLGSIQQGIVSDCWIGYWVHSAYQGQGVATAACALGTDHAFQRVGIHRVTATYLPENLASKQVLHLNGFREEGYLQRNLHIHGRWRDHYLVAQTADEFSSSCVQRLLDAGRLRRGTSSI